MHASKLLGEGPLRMREHLCNNVPQVLQQAGALQHGLDAYLAALEQLKDSYAAFHKQMVHISGVVGGVSSDFRSLSSVWNALDGLQTAVSSQAARFQQHAQDLNTHLTMGLRPVRVTLNSTSRGLQETLRRQERKRASLFAEVQRSKEAYARAAERAAHLQSQILQLSSDQASRVQRDAQAALRWMETAGQTHKANVDQLLAFLDQYNREGPQVLETLEGANRGMATLIQESLTEWVGMHERLYTRALGDVQAIHPALSVIDVNADFSKFIATHAKEPEPDPAIAHRFRPFTVAVPIASPDSPGPVSAVVEAVPPATVRPQSRPAASALSGIKGLFRSPFARVAPDPPPVAEEASAPADPGHASIEIPPRDEPLQGVLSFSADESSFCDPGMEPLDEVFQHYLLSLQYTDVTYVEEQVHTLDGPPGAAPVICQALAKRKGTSATVSCPNPVSAGKSFCGAHACSFCDRPKTRGAGTCGAPTCAASLMSATYAPYRLPQLAVESLAHHKGRASFARALRWHRPQGACLLPEPFEGLRSSLLRVLDFCHVDGDAQSAAALLQAALGYSRADNEESLDHNSLPHERIKDCTLAAALTHHSYCAGPPLWEEWFAAFLIATEDPTSCSPKTWARLVQEAQEDVLVHDGETVCRQLTLFLRLMQRLGVARPLVVKVANRLGDTYVLSKEERAQVLTAIP